MHCFIATFSFISYKKWYQCIGTTFNLIYLLFTHELSLELDDVPIGYIGLLLENAHQ